MDKFTVVKFENAAESETDVAMGYWLTVSRHTDDPDVFLTVKVYLSEAEAESLNDLMGRMLFPNEEATF